MNSLKFSKFVLARAVSRPQVPATLNPIGTLLLRCACSTMTQRLVRNEPLRAQVSRPKKVFFEQAAREPKEDVEPIDINEYKRICGKLEKDPILTKLPFLFRRNLFRLPAAAVRLEQHAHFVDEISQSWYKIFCRQLETNRKSPTTDVPFYTSQDLAVAFNSLVKLDKMTNGRLFDNLGGIMCVQKLTDAIFETDLEIGYRTLAMLVKNINTVVKKAEKSRNLTSRSWSNTKLRWYINKFYRSLEDYHASKRDNFDVISQENAAMVIFYVCHLKIGAPFDEQHLQNIALLLYDFFLSPDNTGNSGDRYLTQFIRLSKLITICNQWDVDIGKILEQSCEMFDDTSSSGRQKLNADQIWSDIFHQVSDLYNMTKKPGVLINDFRLNVLTNCLSLACKFDRESNFVRNLKSTWLENLASNVFNKTQLEEMIVKPLQQNERLARKAARYNSNGCFANLFKILDS